MWDLRWVLLGLGALVRCRGVSLEPRHRVARHAAGASAPQAAHRAEHRRAARADGARGRTRRPSSKPSRRKNGRGPRPTESWRLRLIPRDEELPAERAVTALRNAGLEHGRYAIFHRQLGANREGFSVASLTEPGSFDVDHLGDEHDRRPELLRRAARQRRSGRALRRDGRDGARAIRGARRRSVRRAGQLLEQSARALSARRAHRVSPSIRATLRRRSMQRSSEQRVACRSPSW